MFCVPLSQEVLAWVVRQSWCNGRVGSGGISYDGMAAAQLAAGDETGAVQAVCLQFSPLDLYHDLCYPGGVPCSAFLLPYRHFTYHTERGNPPFEVAMPLLMRVLFGWVLEGPAPAGEDAEAETALKAALAQHQQNWDMWAAMRHILFKDDLLVAADGSQHTAETAGNTAEDLQRIGQRGVCAVYHLGGYYDSGSVRSVTRSSAALAQGRQQQQRVGMPVVCSARNKVTLGPWNHGARRMGSPYAINDQPHFDLVAEMKRFFDAQLCGAYLSAGDAESGVAAIARSSQDQGQSLESVRRWAELNSESPVHYYELGSEQWLQAKEWPVQPSSWVQLLLKPGGSLVPATDRAFDTEEGSTPFNAFTAPGVGEGGGAVESWGESIMKYKVGFGVRAGVASRWNLVQHILLQPLQLLARHPGRLVFVSAPLQRDLHLIGAPRVRLSLRPIGGQDAVILAYLFEQDAVSSGQQQAPIKYLTEGILRAANRGGGSAECEPEQRLPSELPLWSPFDRPHVRVASRPLPADRFTTLDLHLEPLAVCIRRGRCVGLALCGSDVDSFDCAHEELRDGLAKAWELKLSPDSIAGCSLSLPEMHQL